MSLLGIDIGTTGCKAAAFDLSGEQLSSCYEEYPLIVPKSDFCELDPGTVWEAVRGVIEKVAYDVRVSDPVSAIGISTLGDSVTPLDRSGKPLYNTVVGAADRRAVTQAEWIEERVSREELYTLTGAPLHAYCTIPKILWFRENIPDLYERCVKFTGWQEIVHGNLGLEPAMDYSLASRTMLMDIHERRWAGKLFEACGIDESLFHPLAESSRVVGRLDRGHADLLGLKPGVSVVAGGFDQACCALGAGVLKAGEAALTLGTLEAVTAVYDECRPDMSLLGGNYGCSYHVLQDFNISFAYLTTAGAVLRWYRDTLVGAEIEEAGRRGCDPYEVMISSTSDWPSDVFVLPYFTGTGTPWLDLKQRGTVFGLTLDTGRPDIIKGILDGICYETRLNIEYMRDAGIPVDRLRAVGGGSKSKRWMQLMADITGIPVEVMRTGEAGCLGGAILAGLGTGIYKNVEDFADLARVAGVFEPGDRNRLSYEEHYCKYMELRERVRGLHIP
jgi:xylulokinase